MKIGYAVGSEGYAKKYDKIEAKYFLKRENIPLDIDKRICELFNEYRNSTPKEDREEILCKLRTLINIPYGKNLYTDLNKLEDSLNEQVYGQCKAKREVLRKQASNNCYEDSVPALLLVGPSGTGKTSMGKACAYNREFVKIPFGSIKRAEDIVGYKTKPGILLRAISNESNKKDGFTFLFDEIDKCAERPDVLNTLYEILDISSEKGFYESYVETYVKLPNSIIIATCNSLENIPRYLLDRFEIISVEGYSCLEKADILKNYTIRKYEKKYKKSLIIDDDVVDILVKKYCINAGMRDVEKLIEKIFEDNIVENNLSESIIITKDNYIKYVSDMFEHKEIEKTNRKIIGSVNALSVSENGMGNLFKIRVCEKYCNEDVEDTITGLAEGSCKESIILAKQVAENILGKRIGPLHIHLENAGIPKDGPSAGVAFCIAILSSVAHVPVLSSEAMTGEISLDGSIKTVGGVSEKIAAAYRFGAEKVYIPEGNYAYMKHNNDLSFYDGMEIIPVKDIEELFLHCSGKKIASLQSSNKVINLEKKLSG